ncbi:phosphatase PAP2 family protein [Kineosporia sp. R_H_3]|uniref:phosphatase PAP2 family protein n=1 Tax=Kineosporia sp. R_H_3 TaxID=1961848 RepID=UPI000B4AC1CE|nr:phosphatase PAP2 family protein [Kineosporia sp. R_H_3]
MTSPAEPAPRTTWRHVLPRLAGGLLLRWLAILVVLVGLGLLVTKIADTVWPFTVEDDVNRAFENARTAAGNTATLFMSGLGNTSTIVPLCLLMAVVLRLALKRWRESILVVTVTLGQSVVFLLTTLAIDRNRPDVEQLDQSPPTSSFPSGHTSAAIALYTSLAVVVHRRVRPTWLRRLLVVLLLCLPALVATGRLYRGMHHPSDVVGSLVNAGLQIFLADRLLRATPLPDDGDVPRHGVAGPRRSLAGSGTTAGTDRGTPAHRTPGVTA